MDLATLMKKNRIQVKISLPVLIKPLLNVTISVLGHITYGTDSLLAVQVGSSWLDQIFTDSQKSGYVRLWYSRVTEILIKVSGVANHTRRGMTSSKLPDLKAKS